MDRLKRAVADYGAPNVALDEASRQTGRQSARDVWEPEPDRRQTASSHTSTSQASSSASDRGLVGRIVQAAANGGVKVLFACAENSEAACASLKLARALAREGRAVLVQVEDSDLSLRDALDHAASATPEEGQPGLAQLLQGEASFAEAIYRDGATRLHIVQSGGAVAVESDDLHMILDALQATYDYVLVACGPRAAATHLPAEAALTVIFAEDRRARDFLHDDFEAAGARAIALAGLDPQGEIIETAA
jgi:Mrp family chromosome partitioning ATPase